MAVKYSSFWRGRRVLLTGHTGFKGAWLSIWLEALGAEVHGYSLNPPTTPNLYEVAHVSDFIESDTRGDLAEHAMLRALMHRVQPEVVFHLAAQSLVLEGYRDPLGTLASNVTGTAHVLDALRTVDSVRAVVIVTTDKVYANNEWVYPYRESDPLGGHDPYSASKAAAELVTASYRASYFAGQGAERARIASARAGNVIGGADWAADRLVPDCLKAFESGQTVLLRNPGAVRPWQHVLEPLAGYLMLAEALASESGARFAAAWNFGPDLRSNATVGDVAHALAALWGGDARVEHGARPETAHEAGILRLDSSKAHTELGWRPRWSLEQALEHTVEWHRRWLGGGDLAATCREQIAAYEAAGS